MTSNYNEIRKTEFFRDNHEQHKDPSLKRLLWLLCALAIAAFIVLAVNFISGKPKVKYVFAPDRVYDYDLREQEVECDRFMVLTNDAAQFEMVYPKLKFRLNADSIQKVHKIFRGQTEAYEEFIGLIIKRNCKVYAHSFTARALLENPLHYTECIRDRIFSELADQGIMCETLSLRIDAGPQLKTQIEKVPGLPCMWLIEASAKHVYSVVDSTSIVGMEYISTRDEPKRQDFKVTKHTL